MDKNYTKFNYFLRQSHQNNFSKNYQFDLALTIGQKGSGFYACAENGKNGKRFNLIQLYKIAKALDVTVGSFFNDIDMIKSDTH